MQIRRVHSLNDLAERAAMLAPFEETARIAGATTNGGALAEDGHLSSSGSSILSSSSSLAHLSPLVSLASASSIVEPVRPSAQHDRADGVKNDSPSDKKRKRESKQEAEENSSRVGSQKRSHLGRDSKSVDETRSQVKPVSNGLPRQANLSPPSTRREPNSSPFLAPSPTVGSTSSPTASPALSSTSSTPSSTSLSFSFGPSVRSPSSAVVQISPSSIHLRDFMDGTKHLLKVLVSGTGEDAASLMMGDLRLSFGSVLQQVERASAYSFAEVPSALDVLRATGIWQRAFLMEVLFPERCLTVERTLYCGYKRIFSDKFTYYFDADPETLRQLYLQHSKNATSFSFGSSAITLPLPLGMPLASMNLPGLGAQNGNHDKPKKDSLSVTANGHSMGKLANGADRNGRENGSSHGHTLGGSANHTTNSDRVNGGRSRLTRSTSGEDHHRHRSGNGGDEAIKQEEDDDFEDDLFLLRSSANASGENGTGEEESGEQPPAKLFLLPEYCYFDPTVLKKRTIRCIPCKMSLSKMGWRQHILSDFHSDNKANFDSRGQTAEHTGELIYRSAKGALMCLACALLLSPTDFEKHIVTPAHIKKRKEWAMLDHIERWSDILSKKPRYSTASLSPTLSSQAGSSAACDPTQRKPIATTEERRSSEPALATGPVRAELADLFIECYPMTPVTGYTQWVALHSSRNWDARNFEVTIIIRGNKQDRLMVEPLSWKTTTNRGFLFNLAVKFDRTYGPDPVQLGLVVREPRSGQQDLELEIPLGRAIVCSNSSQRLKRLQQLGDEPCLTETEQRVIPHYTQCALVHKGREHRYRVKPLSTSATAAPTVSTPSAVSRTSTTSDTQAPSPPVPRSLSSSSPSLMSPLPSSSSPSTSSSASSGSSSSLISSVLSQFATSTSASPFSGFSSSSSASSIASSSSHSHSPKPQQALASLTVAAADASPPASLSAAPPLTERASPRSSFSAVALSSQ